MTDHRLDNIAIILSGTRNPGNIGSVARAMHNMGLTDLRLSAPQCALNEESDRLARSGRDILERARRFQSLESATNGIHLMVGTTGKSGGNRSQCHTPRALAPRILAHACDQKVGILFGPEDTGLVDEELLKCQMLIRIPTDPDARSINLAQAVMITAYELYFAHLEHEPARVAKLASIEQVEAMFDQLEKALLAIGFLQPQNARHMMFAIRRMLGRAGLEPQDVGILRGIARQIHWYGLRDRGLGPGASKE
jgi:tRNA/rRNA methyltransferase